MELQLSQALELGVLGISSAVLQLATGSLFSRALGCTSSPLRALGRWLIDVMPGSMVDVSIALVEGADKLILLWTLLLLWLSGAGVVYAALGPGPAASMLALMGALGMIASWRRPELPRVRAMVVGVTAAAAGPAAVLLLSPTAAVLAAAAATLVVIVIQGIPRLSMPVGAEKLLPATTPLPEPRPQARLSIPGISSLLTPNHQFYETDVTFPPPRVNPSTWTLEVSGLVARPLCLTFEELVTMPSVEVDATLVCVHNPVGGHRIGTARWQGVPLTALLERVGVSVGADHVLAHSVDGYSGGLPLALLERGFQPLVVYGMNGALLSAGHGAPVRLLVPGIYGYDANVKWLQRLELTKFELARDYWERKGWPRLPAYVKTQSRIDVPRPAAEVEAGPQWVAGVAWSPPRGVTRVELSVDGAPWQACELGAELSPSAWRQWQCAWDPGPGSHSLKVRAWSPDGVQEDGEGAPFPAGAAGLHLVTVKVTARGRAKRNRFAELAATVAARWRLAHAGIRAWRRS